MIIGIALSWILIFGFAVIIGLVAMAVVVITFWITRKVNSIAIRYLIRSVVTAAVFIPTLFPYEWATADQLRWTEFAFYFSPIHDLSGDAHMYLAVVSLVKGFITGKAYLVHAGWVPIFLVAGASWCCAIALKHLWPVFPFCLGAFAHLYGWSLFQESFVRMNHLTLDPFILALVLQASGIALCAGAVIKMILWLLRCGKQPPPLTTDSASPKQT
jgi:hypothetical protein